MAAPESPLCYVGVARQSAAFRLMKQMVHPHSASSLKLFKRVLNCVYYYVRGGKKVKVWEKRSRGLKDTFE